MRRPIAPAMYPSGSASGSAGFHRGVGLILFGMVIEMGSVALGIIQLANGTNQLGLPFAGVAQSLAPLGIVVALAGALLLWVRSA